MPVSLTRKVQYHALAVGFALTAIVLAVCLIGLPVRYETNDELTNIQRLVTQNHIAPEATSPVLSQSLGQVLIFLYKLSPAVPWYGLLLFAALFSGIGFISAVFFKHAGHRYLWIFYLLIAFYAFHCFCFVSFTSAALVAQLGAFIILLDWVVTKQPLTGRPRVTALLILLGILTGYLLRWKLALYFMAFLFPVLLFIKPLHIRRAWPYALILLAVICADRTMARLSVTPDAQQYLVYDELRRVFHDTEKGKYHEGITEAAMEKAGWSLNDWRMFKRWNLYDETRFNIKTLQTFLAANTTGDPATLVSRIPRRLIESFQKSRPYTLAFFYAFLALLVFRFPQLRRYSRLQLIRSSLAFGFVLAMILFFAYYRFSPRVFVPIFLFSFGLAVLMTGLLPTSDNTQSAPPFLPGLWPWVISGLILLLALKYAGNQVLGMKRTLVISKNEKQIIQTCLTDANVRLKARNPVIVNLNPSESLGKEFTHPLKELSDFGGGLFIMPTGTSTHSPRFRRVLKSLGLSGGKDFLEWTIDNPRVFFVGIVRDLQLHNSFLKMWNTYYNRHISLKHPVGLTPVLDYRNPREKGVVFYRMISQADPG